MAKALKSRWLLSSAIFLICGVYFDSTKKVHIEITRPEAATFSLEVSKSDRRKLEYFFRKLILVDSAGYTILGSKPLSLGVYLTPFSPLFFQSLSPRNLRMYFAWRTWEKYKSNFQNTNIMIWSEPNPWVEGAVLILIANKKNFRKTANQHIHLFQKSLSNESLSSKSLIDTASQENLLTEGLESHEGLLGILLGYGEKNSWLFHEQSQGKEVNLSPVWSPKENRINQKKGKLALKVHNPRTYSNLLKLPTFVADKSSYESKELRKKYRQEQKQILNYYEGKSFLETSLALFL